MFSLRQALSSKSQLLKLVLQLKESCRGTGKWGYTVRGTIKQIKLFLTVFSIGLQLAAVFTVIQLVNGKFKPVSS